MNTLDHADIQRIQLMAYEFATRNVISPENAFYLAAKFVKYSNEMAQKMRNQDWSPLDEEGES